ncbi:hypothetical protein BH11MYX3_BH11MYX3_12410 [soil metagenome]
MSEPRQCLPGTFYQITRRTVLQQFLLRPDKETNNAFIYCLAEAAQRFQMEIVMPSALSNHHHLASLDRLGNFCEFTQRFHGLLAKCQNALRHRKENCWSSAEPSIVELADRSAVLASVVYAAANPVHHGLVERVHHWPGVNGLSALLNRRTLTAHRPKHFFDDDGDMPETVTLELTVPPELGDPEAFLREVEEGVKRVEKEHEELRKATGRRVLGRRTILRQSWRDSPESASKPHFHKRGEINPRFATRDPELRAELMTRRQVFLRDYKAARIALLAGTPVPFPRGTYWLRRFVGVPIVSA